ncbi:MATE family efflux transporter [Lachnotalea sp. AF33-28]|uniref:MATE family efflux transporter n=1 Tax=Lachnotalea sp. AF33-28 TaxID=2292046 RepID=UPI000E46CC53|nr:MATE family efflux transporter [Lachnotalea sp. AF33-28]RHP33313.1 MATE family efflux transporter [Lachnotalea sp. AF33-28]
MTKDMTTGSPMKILIAFSIPLLIGNIFQQFYNMVDSIIVGQFVGEDALAAVGSTGSVVFLVLGFAMGIASGFGVLISQAFGAGDTRLLRHYTAMSLTLSMIVTVILTVITVLTARPLLVLMKTPENILDQATAYLTIIFAGMGCTMFYNVLSAILRGIGDSRTPLYFLVLSSVLNVLLDLFCVVTLKLGAAGAAWATVIAQGVSALLCLMYMFKKFDILKLKRDDWKFSFTSAKRLFGVGLPMALQFSITAIGVMILQTAINRFGSTVVAAYTAASKVEQLTTQPMVTLGTTIATYCGQNLGAGRYDRIKKGVRQGTWIAVLATAFAAFISVVFGGSIVKWFLSNPSEEVLGYANTYLRTVSVFFIALSLLYLHRNALQGVGRAMVPMMAGGAEMVTRIFVAIVLAGSFGYPAICLASPLAWVAAEIPLFIRYMIWKKKC